MNTLKFNFSFLLKITALSITLLLGVVNPMEFFHSEEEVIIIKKEKASEVKEIAVKSKKLRNNTLREIK